MSCWLFFGKAVLILPRVLLFGHCDMCQRHQLCFFLGNHCSVATLAETSVSIVRSIPRFHPFQILFVLRLTFASVCCLTPAAWRRWKTNATRLRTRQRTWELPRPRPKASANPVPNKGPQKWRTIPKNPSKSKVSLTTLLSCLIMPKRNEARRLRGLSRPTPKRGAAGADATRLPHIAAGALQPVLLPKPRLPLSDARLSGARLSGARLQAPPHRIQVPCLPPATCRAFCWWPMAWKPCFGRGNVSSLHFLSLLSVSHKDMFCVTPQLFCGPQRTLRPIPWWRCHARNAGPFSGLSP